MRLTRSRFEENFPDEVRTDDRKKEKEIGNNRGDFSEHPLHLLSPKTTSHHLHNPKPRPLQAMASQGHPQFRSNSKRKNEEGGRPKEEAKVP